MVSPIVDAEIGSYIEQHSTPPEPHLVALARETRELLPGSGMLAGPVPGRFLEMLVFAGCARRVLEIGTFSGYSALSMAAGLPPDGYIVTLEVNPKAPEMARRYVAASEYAGRVEVRVGPAEETLEELTGPFDLVFIDADKAGYKSYYEAVLPKLAEHGLIVADNTLWGGRVLDPDDQTQTTRAIVEFNDHVRADPRTVCVLLPVRDGITLIRRKSPCRTQADPRQADPRRGKT